MGKLDNRVAIVTGAAQGIGRAVAEKLRAEGASVVGADIQEGTEITADVSQEDDVRSMVEQTVAQLEHALTARVRVEQAIGVLAERHRLRPRQAFDLLRKVARSGGRRVIELAENVVDSASNPLLALPEELARKQPPARKRGRSPRHAHAAS